MSIEDLMPHTAEVHRRDNTTDRFGQQITAFDPNHSTLQSTFSCRLSRLGRAGGMFEEERTKYVYALAYELFASPGADVHEDDVVRVLGPYGDELVPEARVHLIRSVYDSGTLHHLEIILRVRRGPELAPGS